MKFVFLMWHRSYGGAERSISLLSSQLVKAGQEVHIVQMMKKEDEYPIDEHVKIHVNYRKKDFVEKIRFIRTLRFIFWQPIMMVRKLKADIVVPVLDGMDDRAFWATRFSTSKLVMAIRNNPSESPKEKVIRWKRNFFCFCADAIFVQNEGQASYFPKFMKRKIFAVPNIIEETFFRIQISPKYKIRRFITAGRLHPQKNQQLLIRAFKKMILETKNEDAVLLIYGAGGQEDCLKSLIEELEMKNRVFLKGRSNALTEEYAKADAFILSSNYEGSPNALLEAMAAGLPCISTNCPYGPADYIKNGINGLLVPTDNLDALTEAMKCFLMDFDYAKELGKRAKEFMREQNSAEKIAALFIEKCRRL